MRHCLMLDLKDDPALIAGYEAHHRAVWPEVAQHLRDAGITSMEIYRLGTRLCMFMETNDERFNAARKAEREANNPRLLAWETLMWHYQAPTPWTPEGQKWVEAARIFDLASSG